MTFALSGLEATLIETQIDLSGKAPKFSIIGLPDGALREARYRVKIGLRNAGYYFPYNRVIVHLTPANLRKKGAQYDLPMAMGILVASQQLPNRGIDDVIFVGEMGLDGSILPVPGVIAMVEAAYRAGFKKMIVPKANAVEAAFCDLVQIYPAAHLQDVVAYVINWKSAVPFTPCVKSTPPVDSKDYSGMDYSEIVGQEYSKRAMLISAAGCHHCLMIGSPGAGKTMLAQRLPTILPPLSVSESMETTRVHSIAGILPKGVGLITTAPFRSPHHTTSAIGIVGGGSDPRPGELSLANHGVLFLDEFAEFSRNVLEVLRQPLESGSVTIARAKETVTYPAHFLLIAAMNPCPCGYLYDAVLPCTCTSHAIQSYLQKISGPLWDRFDLQVQVDRVHFRDLMSNSTGISSAVMREKVLQVREMQKKRWAPYKFSYNAEIPVRLLKKFCAIDATTEELLQKAMEQRGFSARALHKILRIARTLADLDNKEKLSMAHVAEALQYRALDNFQVAVNIPTGLLSKSSQKKI